MKLTPAQREAVRMMFGGKCAYCGIELDDKWHVDHIEAVGRDGKFVDTGTGVAKWELNGKLRSPENDRLDNLFPACVKCNVLKGMGNVETLRSALTYFAHSIPKIRTYSHVHHLLRFKKLHIDGTQVVFWFEKFQAQKKDG